MIPRHALGRPRAQPLGTPGSAPVVDHQLGARGRGRAPPSRLSSPSWPRGRRASGRAQSRRGRLRRRRREQAPGPRPQRPVGEQAAVRGDGRDARDPRPARDPTRVGQRYGLRGRKGDPLRGRSLGAPATDPPTAIPARRRRAGWTRPHPRRRFPQLRPGWARPRRPRRRCRPRSGISNWSDSTPEKRTRTNTSSAAGLGWGISTTERAPASGPEVG